MIAPTANYLNSQSGRPGSNRRRPAWEAVVGGLRSQFHHIIDIAPTILDVCGLQQPSSVNGVAQKPIEGVSMAYTFDNGSAPSTRNTHYFEMPGNRGIHHDGWVAATTPPTPPWSPSGADVDPITGYNWELYHAADDFSEADDLAKQQPAQLAELQKLFYDEAATCNVLPIDNSKTARLDPVIRPSHTRGRTSFTYRDGMVRIPEGATPDVKNPSASPRGGNQGRRSGRHRHAGRIRRTLVGDEVANEEDREVVHQPVVEASGARVVADPLGGIHHQSRRPVEVRHP